MDSQLDICHRNRCAGPCAECVLCRWRCCNRQRFPDVRLRRSQAGRHLLIRAKRLVLRLSQPGVLVLRDHGELGDQLGPVKHEHRLRELYTTYRAARRSRPRLVQRVRHGHLSQFVACVHHLHDQVATPYTDTPRIAEPESRSAFSVSVALTKSVVDTCRDQRNAFRGTTKFGAAGISRRRRSQCPPTLGPHRRDYRLAVGWPPFAARPDSRSVALQELAYGCRRKRGGHGNVGS